MNTLKTETEIDEQGRLRIWVFIDGEKRFVVGIDCLQDCFLTRGAPATDFYLKNHLLRSPCEKIIDYGFCVEDCCASTLAEIHYEPEVVRWTHLRPSTGEVADPSIGYVFAREAYDLEVGRCVVFLLEHYYDLYMRLRYPNYQPEEAAPPGSTVG